MFARLHIGTSCNRACAGEATPCNAMYLLQHALHDCHPHGKDRDLQAIHCIADTMQCTHQGMVRVLWVRSCALVMHACMQVRHAFDLFDHEHRGRVDYRALKVRCCVYNAVETR